MTLPEVARSDVHHELIVEPASALRRTRRTNDRSGTETDREFFDGPTARILVDRHHGCPTAPGCEQQRNEAGTVADHGQDDVAFGHTGSRQRAGVTRLAYATDRLR